MKPPEVRQLRVRQLHDKLAECVFAVPKLQREFVWNGARAAALLDSIYRHMPIGSLLVWETGRDSYNLLRHDLHVLPAFNANNRYCWFLIDGQQRLSVLHQVAKGETLKNSSGQDIHFGRVCFDLNPDQENADAQRFVYRKPVERQLVSVSHVLAPNWKRRFKGYPKYLMGRIAECRHQLREYRVPVVVVHSDDLEEVREVFVRINAQGMKISAADRAFARASAVDLRDLAHNLRMGVHKDFRDVDFNVVLQGFAFVTHERELDVGQRALEASIGWWERQREENGKLRAFDQRWNKYRLAFQKAADYIVDNFNVLDLGFLPSENMLAVLSVFRFHHPAQPNSHQRREIKKWFWATGVGQRYSGRGYRQNLIADVEFFRRLAKSNARFKFEERIDPIDILRSEYGKGSAINSAFYCLLLTRDPRHIATGEAIAFDTEKCRSNRGDRHHIFPRHLLAANRMSHRDYNSLCNICLIAAEENQGFGSRHPRSYLADVRSRKHFKRAMKSHLIPYDVGSGLWLRGARKAYLLFRKQRLALICRAFESEAGIKLFRKSV